MGELAFDPAKGVVFDYGLSRLGHASGMVLRAFDAAGNLRLTETYYSIGSGFVLTERELKRAVLKGDGAKADRLYPFAAAEMLAMGETFGLSIAPMKRANETAGGPAGLDRLWQVMNACIDRGLATDGTVPGGLKVRRRARAIQCVGATHRGIRDFLLTAATLGGIIKTNASISGVEVGCQGEVGSAAAMAAADLCTALGGSNAQVENAAEFAFKHHLGMACDPEPYSPAQPGHPDETGTASA